MADFFLNQIQGHFYGPQVTALPSLGTFACNAANDSIEWIFQAQAADAITHLLFNVSGVSAPPVVTAQLCSVDAAGRANTGAVLASATFTPVVGINAVAMSYTPTRGQQLAARISAAGFAAGATATFVVRATGLIEGVFHVITIDGGVATRQANTHAIFGYRTASRSYGFPVKAITQTAFNSTVQRGAKFNPPAGWGDSYQIGGVAWGGRTGAAGSNTIYGLYTSPAGGAARATDFNLDTDASVAASSGHSQRIVFPTLVTIPFGSPAYLTMEPQGAATNNYIVVFEFETAGDAAAMGGGIFSYIERASGAVAFTESPTKVPLVSVFLADWTEPVGGGGAVSAYSRGRVVNQ